MRIETTRIIADWLLHATKGANHYIPLVPRDGGDPAPPLLAAWVDPDTRHTQVTQFAVFDDTRHPWVIKKGEVIPATPCLFVALVGPIDVTGEPWPNGDFRTTTTPAQVVIGYITDNEDLFAAVRDGEYTLRAVARSMRELMKNENEASNLRNGVRIIAMQPPMRYIPMNEVVGGGRMSGGLLVTLEAEDGTPSF